MKMKKLAIASAMALMSIGAAYAQQTPVTTTSDQADAAGLMSTLTTSLGNLFNAGRTDSITETITGSAGISATYRSYVAPTTVDSVYTANDAAKNRYSFNEVTGVYTQSDSGTLVVDVAARAAVPGLVKVTGSNPIDITALAGAVNLAAINGGINITGVNVGLTGIAGNVQATATAATSSTALAINGNNLSTTVIGAMNSSTLDIAKMTQNLSDMTSSTLNIAGLANQGAAPSITTQSFGPGQLGLGTIGSTILDAAVATTQFDMHGLVSGTDTLASSMTDKLQTMNVFNMAVNMAPLVAGVNIAAAEATNAWFLNPQTGVVNLSGLQVATTAIGAMNSSVTRLGAKLSN